MQITQFFLNAAGEKYEWQRCVISVRSLYDILHIFRIDHLRNWSVMKNGNYNSGRNAIIDNSILDIEQTMMNISLK
jgi:hypothetical protein